MDTTTFDALTVRLGSGISRRRLLGRFAGTAAAAAVVATGLQTTAKAAVCPYGANTCLNGYVWREATSYDLVCVTPDQRDQAYYDNQAGPGRIDPNGAWGPNTCVSGYVFRLATPDDLVCVTPAQRDQVAYENSYAAGNVDPECRY